PLPAPSTPGRQQKIHHRDTRDTEEKHDQIFLAKNLIASLKTLCLCASVVQINKAFPDIRIPSRSHWALGAAFPHEIDARLQ
ncbi:MAG: hypothetical protein V3S74_00620, partial [Alphaproteobacteria bacterium]